MKKQDFYFDLPEALIAQTPLPNRSDSRLLCYTRHDKQTRHESFKNLANLLKPGDLLVMNNSKVIPARLFGTKDTGGKVELLIERMLNHEAFMAHIKASKALKPGARVFLEKAWQIRIIEKKDDLYHCILDENSPEGSLETMMDEIGHVPLPLYIDRSDKALDKTRYQTIYAEHKGSVAAPTAGLHFDDFIFHALKERGIQIAYLTLHVGAGTFRPLRCESLQDHVMHYERCTVSASVCDIVNQAKKENKRIIAVGTTALRTLESAAKEGSLRPYDADTNLFIYPGYSFKICDGLLTNFHLPESTLLMLVAALVGHPETMALYQEAIREQYRFYSYGDACLFL